MSDSFAALPERVQRKIERVDDGCWLWVAGLRDGYGQLRQGKSVRQAHRVVFELLVGDVPDGLDLDHLCRVRSCVNPDHLEPVTRRTNLLRGETLAAANAAKVTCPRGHSLVARPSGQRICPTCRRGRRAVKKEKVLTGG